MKSAEEKAKEEYPQIEGEWETVKFHIEKKREAFIKGFEYATQFKQELPKDEEIKESGIKWVDVYDNSYGYAEDITYLDRLNRAFVAGAKFVINKLSK